MLLAGFKAALASTGNVAASQASASRSPSSGRRQPAHWLWCLLCLEADARDDLPDVFLPGIYYCSEAPWEQILQGERGECTIRGMSGQGQRGRGWIAFLDNTKEKIGKFNRDRKHTTCPVPPAPLRGPGQFLLAIEDALGPDTGYGLFILLLRFIIPGVKINNNKSVWPSRPRKRPDSLHVCSYSAKFTSELFIYTFWPDWQHHIHVRFSTEILFQTLLGGL